MRFAGVALILVERPRPQAVADRFVGVLVEALAQELRTTPPPVHPATIPTALGHRGNAAVLLNRTRAVVARAVRAERGQQARREDRPGAGETREDRRIFMRGEQRGLPGFVEVDRDGQRAQV